MSDKTPETDAEFQQIQESALEKLKAILPFIGKDDHDADGMEQSLTAIMYLLKNRSKEKPFTSSEEIADWLANYWDKIQIKYHEQVTQEETLTPEAFAEKRAALIIVIECIAESLGITKQTKLIYNTLRRSGSAAERE